MWSDRRSPSASWTFQRWSSKGTWLLMVDWCSIRASQQASKWTAMSWSAHLKTNLSTLCSLTANLRSKTSLHNNLVVLKCWQAPMSTSAFLLASSSNKRPLTRMWDGITWCFLTPNLMSASRWMLVLGFPSSTAKKKRNFKVGYKTRIKVSRAPKLARRTKRQWTCKSLGSNQLPVTNQ